MVDSRHPKSVRRRLLLLLYEAYVQDPLRVLGPEEIVAAGTVSEADLVSNIHYLHDRGLVNLAMSHLPPMFSSAHITADGMDLVENHYEFNLRFPPEPEAVEQGTEEIPMLVERLVEEIDLAPTDGETRKATLRDVQYLRDEVARPLDCWRGHVLESVLQWIEDNVHDTETTLPSLGRLRTLILAQVGR